MKWQEKRKNGARAIDKYKELNPDLVIMDITMPEMDGIAAVREIKKINADSKIIMCSAMVSRPWLLSQFRREQGTLL